MGNKDSVCKFAWNPDRSLSPLNMGGKLLSHLAVGIKKGSGEPTLVSSDSPNKIKFSFARPSGAGKVPVAKEVKSKSSSQKHKKKSVKVSVKYSSSDSSDSSDSSTSSEERRR